MHLSQVARLTDIYKPLPFFDPKPTYKKQLQIDTSLSRFSFHKILILCSEILEMTQKIPSVAENGKFVDMRLGLCPAVVRLAARLEDYYDDPTSITQKDIQKDVIRVSDHS